MRGPNERPLRRFLLIQLVTVTGRISMNCPALDSALLLSPRSLLQTDVFVEEHRHCDSLATASRLYPSAIQFSSHPDSSIDPPVFLLVENY